MYTQHIKRGHSNLCSDCSLVKSNTTTKTHQKGQGGSSPRAPCPSHTRIRGFASQILLPSTPFPAASPPPIRWNQNKCTQRSTRYHWLRTLNKSVSWKYNPNLLLGSTFYLKINILKRWPFLSKFL